MTNRRVCNRVRDLSRNALSSTGALILIALMTFIGVVTGEEENPLPAGTYRLDMIMASTTRVPFFGASKSASKSVSLVEIRRDDNGLVQTHRVCEFRVLEDSKMIKMIFPEKFIAALATHSYPIQLEKDTQGWSNRADLGIERIGYRASAPDDKLPTKIDDPSVFDWDDDGHPGATLKLSIPLLPTGELYVVQRGQSILTGRVTQPGKIEGGIEVRNFDQKVLGAWPGFLAKSPEIEPNAKESRFTLSRIAADSDCDTLREANVKP